MNLTYVQAQIESLDSQLRYGCGNHGCRIKSPTGMGTNSLCQCTPYEIRRQLLSLADQFSKQRGEKWTK